MENLGDFQEAFASLKPITHFLALRFRDRGARLLCCHDYTKGFQPLGFIVPDIKPSRQAWAASLVLVLL
jgi:hypothetical protein